MSETAKSHCKCNVWFPKEGLGQEVLTSTCATGWPTGNIIMQ